MCTINQLDSLLQRVIKVITDIFGYKLNKAVSSVRMQGAIMTTIRM